MSDFKINDLIGLEGIAGDGIEPFVMLRHASVFAPKAPPLDASSPYDDSKEGVITAPLRRHEAIAMRDWLSTWIDLTARNENPPPPDTAPLDVETLNAAIDDAQLRYEDRAGEVTAAGRAGPRSSWALERWRAFVFEMINVMSLDRGHTHDHDEAIAIACYEAQERGERTNVMHEYARLSGSPCPCAVCTPRKADVSDESGEDDG